MKMEKLEKKDLDKIECILRTILTFWNNPNLENSIEKARNSTKVKCFKIGQCEENSVYLINGDIVKQKCFPDFVEGGNDAVYGKKKGEIANFMPDDHIWIDANIDINSIPYICFHELYEKYQMEEHGLEYDDAHIKADQIEMRLRKSRQFEQRRNVLPFPRVQQPRSGECGHACISMILQYFELRETVGELEDEPQCKKDKDGLSPESIVEILEKFKIKSSIMYDLSFEEIQKIIDDGRPLIIELQAYKEGSKELDKSWIEGQHYIVAIGYTLEHIIFADPSCFFRTQLKFEELLPRWHDTDNGKKNQKLAIVIDSCPKKEFDEEKIVKQD